MARKTYGINDAWRAALNNGLMDYYASVGWNVWRWNGLPKTLPRKYPESFLFDYGMCTAFVPDGQDEGVILPVATESIMQNYYAEPTSWRAVPLAGPGKWFDQKLTPENAVLIRNSDTYTATRPYVQTLVDQIVNTELTMRMNINAQKCPMIFKSNNGNKALENKNDFVQMMESEPVFFKTDAMDDFEFYTAKVPIVTDALIAVYTEYDARILQYLGVNNLPIEKKERLLVDEVGVNDEECGLILKGRLEQRRAACDAMNDLFGWDASVEITNRREGSEGFDVPEDQDVGGEEDVRRIRCDLPELLEALRGAFGTRCEAGWRGADGEGQLEEAGQTVVHADNDRIGDTHDDRRTDDMATEWFLEAEGKAPLFTEFFGVWNETDEETGLTKFRTMLDAECTAGGWTNLSNHAAEIDRYVTARFAFREIGAETKDAYTAMLEQRLMEIAPMYDMSFKKYDADGIESLDIKQTNTQTTTFQDTPNGKLTDKYATNITDVATEGVTSEGTNVEATNNFLQRYRYLVQAFADDLEETLFSTVTMI